MSKSEHAQILELNSIIQPLYQDYWNDREILAVYPEASFFVEYANGAKLKIRTDALIFWSKAGIYGWSIVDLKTLTGSAYSPNHIAKTIHNFKYDLSAVMYYTVLTEVLKDLPTIQALAGDSVQGIQQTSFDLFFVSKDKTTARYIENFISETTTTKEIKEWIHYGALSFITALRKFQNIKVIYDDILKQNGGVAKQQIAVGPIGPLTNMVKWSTMAMADEMGDLPPLSNLEGVFNPTPTPPPLPPTKPAVPAPVGDFTFNLDTLKDFKLVLPGQEVNETPNGPPSWLEIQWAIEEFKGRGSVGKALEYLGRWGLATEEFQKCKSIKQIVKIIKTEKIKLK